MYIVSLLKWILSSRSYGVLLSDDTYQVIDATEIGVQLLSYCKKKDVRQVPEIKAYLRIEHANQCSYR